MSLPATMQTGLYFGHEDIRAVERPVPEIGPNEVLASVMACGICGSDTMQWYREPQARKRGGINTGHEIAGQIVKVGGNVQAYRAGQRVIITHHFPCLQCSTCKDGNETACPAMHHKHIDPGGFSQFVRVFESGLAHGLYPLPDSMDYEQGSFVEPLGCVVRSVRKTAPVECHSILVLGCGLAGLLHIRLARALGASRIWAVDTNRQRLEAAAQAGADELRLATDPLPAAERVFVCTGSTKAADAALDAVVPGGHVMFFAADGPDQKLAIPLTRFWTSQPSILFSYGAAPRDMTEAIDFIASGKVRVDDLVTHRFPLNRIGEAFELFTNPRDTTLKIIVQPHHRD
jgi:L-iditol 2-dehydrogenase